MVLPAPSKSVYSSSMVKGTLGLLLAALVVRSAAAAPMEIRVLQHTTSAPLAVPGLAAFAPILGVGAAVPAQSVATAPMFVVSAALSAAPPAAAAPRAAAEAAVSAKIADLLPAAESAAPSSSLRPAAAVAASQTLEAVDIFDGRGAHGSAASVAAARSQPPSDKELEGLFAAAMPNSPAVAVFNRMGGFEEKAYEISRHYTFVKDDLLAGVESMPEARGLHGRAFVQSVKDLVAVADARQDPASRRFMEALGRAAAHEFFVRQRAVAEMTARGLVSPGEGVEGRDLPRNSLDSGEYWDMAAGMNAAHFIMKELEPGTHYSFFDLSPLVVSYLRTVAELQGADVSVVEGDIQTLTRPARPLAVLRSKNAVAYVPNFEKKLEEMADWIAPGGRLVLQNDPTSGQRDQIIKKHGPLALRLLQQGWDLSIEFADQPGAEHALDTLIFTRPKAAAKPRTAAAAEAAWGRYILAARRAGQLEMLRFFFR
jgi:hypothetical protein